MAKARLQIIPLGGLGEIGKNMTVFRYGDEIIVIDAGMAFPEEDMLGIDIVIPDFSYLIENKDKIKAILITHGHEDHIGSLSYLLRDVSAPVYATRLTCGLIEGKLKEAHISNYDLHVVKSGDEFKAGSFKFGFFHVCHSIPDSCGIYLRTPIGTIVHTGDFKFDHSPVDGEQTDMYKLAELGHRGVLVLCADNGVVAQGVSQTDQSVTRAVAENLAARRTSVCQMAKTARCEVVPVDLGMAGEPVPGVQNCRIAAGTADFTTGPAMTRQQAVDAIAAGIGLVRAQKAAGVQLLATGEMGIGNTTTSSAVAAVLLGQPVERMTGRGAGLSDAGLARKLDAIRRGIARNRPDAADPLDVLSKLGGFDIAGLCGVFLGGALEGLPVLMDGFISGVAALCAVRLCPAAAKAVFASHVSAEPAAHMVLDALGKAPLITANLHLGEGTGAVASIPLWDMALAVYRGCYSFAEGGIAPYTPQC